eukprot:1047238-Ditylum_brightwellii.AAC.1
MSACRILLRKCLALGMMYPTWFSRLMRLSRSLKVAVFVLIIPSRSMSHLVALLWGKAIVNALVLMAHP